MAYCKEIIEEIDSVVLAASLTDKRFTNRKFAGLCYLTPVKIQESGQIAFAPTKINTLNDYQIVVPDDSFNLITYHRITAAAHSRDADDFGSMQSNYEVLLTVISFMPKVRLTPDQLEALFLAGLPFRIGKTFTDLHQMSRIDVEVVSSNFDSVSIFNNEYRGEKYFLKPDTIFFQIRYRIEATYDKSCLTLCCSDEEA